MKGKGKGREGEGRRAEGKEGRGRQRREGKKRGGKRKARKEKGGRGREREGREGKGREGQARRRSEDPSICSPRKNFLATQLINSPFLYPRILLSRSPTFPHFNGYGACVMLDMEWQP